MTGFSEAEMGAVFLHYGAVLGMLDEGSQTHDESDTLLSLLRDLDQAPSPTAKGLPLDHHYQLQIDNMKNSSVKDGWKGIFSSDTIRTC